MENNDYKIRYGVRVFLIKENKIVCIKYKNEHKGFYDTPGGGIEQNETEEETCIREFKEETGMNISNLEKIGNHTVIYDELKKKIIVSTYIAKSYTGNPISNKENEAMWIDINELLKKEKKLPNINLINKKDFNITFWCDKNHNVRRIEYGK